MRCSLPGVALILILPVVSAVCFSRLIASPGSLIADGRRPSVDHADRGHSRGLGNDLTSVFLPRFCYIVGRIRENGRTPAWDATGFGGRPLVGNPQAGLNYPPAWVAWRVGHTSALGWLTGAHLLWAGVGVYVLTRALGFGRPAAVVAGGCFQASPYLIAHTFEGHYPHVWAASWYPWTFWAVYVASQRKALGFWVLPAVLAMTFLAGHPQEWYFLVVAVSVWVLADGVRDVRAGTPRVGVARVVAWGGLLALSLGLCAVDLAPAMAVKPWLLKSSAIPLDHINRYQLHAPNLLQLLSPFALGRPEDYAGRDNYWETVLSIGLAPLVLAVVGAACYRDRALVRRWGTVVVVAVVFAAGRRLGLYAVAYAILPGMEWFRVPSRSLFLASLGASVLAGTGMQTILDLRPAAPEWLALRVRLRTGLVAVGILAVLVGFLSGSRSGEVAGKPAPPFGNGLSAQYERSREAIARHKIGCGAIFWVSVAGMFGAVSVGRKSRLAAAWGLGAIALIEPALYARSLLVWRAPAGTFLGGRVFEEGRRFFKNETSGPIRVASVGAFYPDLGAVALGLEKTNVNDGFQIQHAADLYGKLYPILEPAYLRGGVERPMDAAVDEFYGTNAQAVMDVMSVRYLVADRAVVLRSVERMRAWHDGPAVWRNRTAMPRAYVVPGVVVGVGDDGGTFARRLSERDPRDGVVMSSDPLPRLGDRQPYTPALWTSRDPDVVTVRVETRAPGLLVVGNTWMPGWSATVDGSPVPVLRGNHCQQVVAVAKPGRHEVVLRYDPPGLGLGKAITAGVIFVWGGLGLVLLAGHVRWPAWDGFAVRVAAPATS